MEVNHPLVDPHLVPVPSLGSLATRGFSSGDLKNLCGHANGSLHLEFRLTCTSDQVSTHFMK